MKKKYFITKIGKYGSVMYFSKKPTSEPISKQINFGLQGYMLWEIWSVNPLDRISYESREEAEQAICRMLSLDAKTCKIREE